MAKPDVADEVDHQEQKPSVVTIDLILSPLERSNHLVVNDNQNKVAEDQEVPFRELRDGLSGWGEPSAAPQLLEGA